MWTQSMTSSGSRLVQTLPQVRQTCLLQGAWHGVVQQSGSHSQDIALDSRAWGLQTHFQ
jgi:hypothetical protein